MQIEENPRDTAKALFPGFFLFSAFCVEMEVQKELYGRKEFEKEKRTGVKLYEGAGVCADAQA